MIEIADGSDSDDDDSDVEFVGEFNNPERCSSPLGSCLGTLDSESSSLDIIDLTQNDSGHYQRRRNKTNSFEVTEIIDDDVTPASVIGAGRPWILIEEPEVLIDLTENTTTENQRSSHSVDVVELEDEELCSTHSEDSKHFLSFKDNPWVSGEIFKGSKMLQGDDVFSTSSLSLSSDSDCSFLLPTAYYLNDSRLEFLEQHDKKKETNYNLNALGEDGNSSNLNALGEISSPPENMYAPAYFCNEEIEKHKEGCNQSEKIFSETACSIQLSNEQTQMPKLERYDDSVQCNFNNDSLSDVLTASTNAQLCTEFILNKLLHSSLANIASSECLDEPSTFNQEKFTFGGISPGVSCISALSNAPSTDPLKSNCTHLLESKNRSNTPWPKIQNSSSMKSSCFENMSSSSSSSPLIEQSDSDSGICYVDQKQLQWHRLNTGNPVQHIFPRFTADNENPEEMHGSEGDEENRCWSSRHRSLKPEPMSSWRLRLVESTIEEKYPKGTLEFLFDFVSPEYYPPNSIISHVLCGILLDPNSEELVTEAYGLLMKIQQLHPAGLSTVQWDWELLSSVMMDKECQLSLATQRMFLQYVVQTLSDDFQMNVILQSLQLSIVKSTLSCDKKFVNVRNVVDWLFTFVISSTSSEESKKQTENKNETFKRKDAQERLSMICLLQKMLKLAMEVDRSPTCSSSKLSQELFQSMANIVTSRQQRALFLTSLDSPLLCCKVLELYLNNLCLCKTTQPLSLNLILHFLHHARLPLDSEDNKIEQWDELLFLLQLMIQSYQEVVHENLRRSILDREKHFGEPPVLGNGDILTEREIEADFAAFQRRVSDDLGQPMDAQLEMKCNLLQMLFIGFIQS
ncbi:SUMO-interacting motif-containing protein 1 isoform X1 [Erpetoichthys calabaricus]|uniref:SUMO-interacting motif-containing protein 1 isoform X1 n=1 Tax=Erpetoichthys calabaricus TaxID=27687 RepID=UPI002234C30B|nr:SUMO-interacting motif-containing protein 1 isoform X1 [Erpetoichthys calabaricus]